MTKQKPYQRRGRPPVHAGYSSVKAPAVRKYLSIARAGLVSDLGGEKVLTTQQLILVDAVTSMLGVTRSIEEHIRGIGIMAGDDIAPSLRNSYLAYRNSIQRHLALLGLKRMVPKLTRKEVIAEIDGKEGNNGS